MSTDWAYDLFGFARAPDGSFISENFAAWFQGSRVVDPDGRPVRCYHGTDRDFDVFESRCMATVYYVDGQEAKRADSWDMGDDRKGVPDAYHYMAILDASHMGAEEALRFRTQEARGSDHPDTLRMLADLRRLLGRQVLLKHEDRPSGAGFYFTPDLSYSFVRDIGARDGGNVVPVYLNLRNPVFLNASQIEGAGHPDNVARYIAQGYDGAIFAEEPGDIRRRGWNGSPQIVAFYPHQIKSAVGNSGLFDGSNPGMTDSHAWDAPARRDRMRA